MREFKFEGTIVTSGEDRIDFKQFIDFFILRYSLEDVYEIIDNLQNNFIGMFMCDEEDFCTKGDAETGFVFLQQLKEILKEMMKSEKIEA